MLHPVRLIRGLVDFLCRRSGRLAGVDWLVVGLGNPGEKYRQSRHNAGFRVVDEIAARHGAGEAFRTRQSMVRVLEDGGRRAALVQPQTFMNRCGQAVGGLAQQTGVAVEKCVVVVDDINLPVRRLRVRRGGSDGGHNGLKSVIAALGDGFPRVRVGVGPVPGSVPLIDFVLAPLDAAEVPRAREAEGQAAEAVMCLLAQGVEAAMNRYN